MGGEIKHTMNVLSFVHGYESKARKMASWSVSERMASAPETD